MGKINKNNYRAKAKNQTICQWVSGTYFCIDDNKNNPFNTLPIKRQHFIVSYCSGDWNMGGWDNIEILLGTLQQNTGLKDENEKDIFEGDILRVYTQVSYDEDGECTVGTEYKEGVVIYENGAFKLHNGMYLHEIEPSFEYKVYIIENVIDSKNNSIAIDYRMNLLCDNFNNNRLDDYPNMIDLAFLDLAKNAAKIPMDDFVCSYDVYNSDMNIIFIRNGIRFILSEYIKENNNDEFDERYEITCSTGGCNSNNFNDIIEFVEKRCKKNF